MGVGAPGRAAEGLDMNCNEDMKDVNEFLGVHALREWWCLNGVFFTGSTRVKRIGW